MDPSGSYLVCSYSNKSICLYDFISGEMVAQAMGHGEVITGVTFLPDCKHIVSVSYCYDQVSILIDNDMKYLLNCFESHK